MTAAALLALGGSLLGPLPAAFGASAVSVLDSGGRRVGSASYLVDASLGSLGGVSAAASPQVVTRLGYPGQLYEVQSLALGAAPTNVNEAGTSQLGAKAMLADATCLSLAATSVTWSVVSGPIAASGASGLASATNVYQNTTATVRADYQSKPGTLLLSVLNVGNDDFGLYAHDGLDDAWQVRYFGLNHPHAGPASDPDRDGAVNSAEYVADTNPTNALSYFHTLGVSNRAGFEVFFQSSASRNYTLYYRTNLAVGGWTNIASQTDVAGHGAVDVLTDPTAAGNQRFYRIGVRVP
jgi:hypothetical protein